jgi:hypothetical protein
MTRIPVGSNCFFQPTLVRFSFQACSSQGHNNFVKVAIEEQYKFTNTDPPRLFENMLKK